MLSPYALSLDMRSMISVTDGMPSGPVGTASKAAEVTKSLTAGVLPAWQIYSRLSLASRLWAFHSAKCTGQRSVGSKDNGKLPEKERRRGAALVSIAWAGSCVNSAGWCEAGVFCLMRNVKGQQILPGPAEGKSAASLSSVGRQAAQNFIRPDEAVSFRGVQAVCCDRLS